MANLFDLGLLPCPGNDIAVDDELRGKPVPNGLAQADWMFTAAIREDANFFEDLDDGEGAEAETSSAAMLDWTRQVLGLEPLYIPCVFSGELEALIAGQAAIDLGGIAFLNIHSDLIRAGDAGDTALDVHYQKINRMAGLIGGPAASVNSGENSSMFPNHWVVLLGDVAPAHPTSNDQLSFRLWSWGDEYIVTAKAEDFTEYLWSVVIGLPVALPH